CYMDDDELRMTKTDGAIRLRNNNQKEGVLNIKPGGGRLDNKTGIRQRIEISMDLLPSSDVSTVRDLLTKLNEDKPTNILRSTVYNHAAREVAKLDESIVLENALGAVIDVEQERHKFTIKNTQTGVELEVSLDTVNASTIKDIHS